MKVLKPREIPEERLSSTDETGKRVYIHPADVSGRFKNRRKVVHAIMILIFLLLPWMKINGHQALLLDLPNRRFAIFGLTFWAHDAPMLLFILLGGAITITLITAIWGRFWCGWGCPQTVFIESVFRKIERWVEGDAVKQRQLDQSEWNGKKIFKKSFKWFLFLVVSLLLSHSFLAYFVGAERLAEFTHQNPFIHPDLFLLMLGFTALVLFDFGWFREQFCIILCPYGRFQSVLLDSRSLVIYYDTLRGEPRRGISKEQEGDCVNCYKCVDVCPTGIDIRRGLQMECIACTACIDACDTVMDRLKKPRGLIRYTSIAKLKQLPGLLSYRAIIYSFFLLLIGAGMTWTLLHRSPIQITFVRAKTPYQEIKNEDESENENENEEVVINQYKVDLRNQKFETAFVKIIPLPPVNETFEIIAPSLSTPLKGGEKRRLDLFVKFPKNFLREGKAELPILIKTFENSNKETGEQKENLTLLGPYESHH